MKDLKKYLGLFGILLFLFIIYKIGLNNIIFSVLSANPVLIGFSLIPMSFMIVLQSLRWKMIVKNAGYDLSLADAIIFFLKGYFLGAVTPGKVGDFYRSKFLSEHYPVPIGISFFTVFIDRICDIVTIIGITILGLVFLSEFRQTQILFIFSLLIIAGLGGLLLYVTTNKKIISKFVYPIFERFIPAAYKDNVYVSFDDFYLGYSHFFEDRGVSLKITILSISTWLTAGLGFYLLALSLALDVSYGFILTTVLIGSLIALIPLSVNGLGTREAVIIFLFSTVMISPESAMAFSLLCIVWNYLPIIPSIVLYQFYD